jgi:carbon-monoxide dehydrogenase large subunit
MPYKLPRLEPGGPAVDTECDTGDYGEALHRCLAEFDWSEKCKLQGRLINGRYHGIAVACFIEGAGDGPKETARLELARTARWRSMSAPPRSGRALKR